MEKLIKFECAYCDKNFTLRERDVKRIERIAKIKCPYCDGTEDLVEVSTDEDSFESLFYDLLNLWEENERKLNYEYSTQPASQDEKELLNVKNEFIKRFKVLKGGDY